MKAVSRTSSRGKNSLPKSPTGIRGLDQVTFGGLPRGRATLIAGGPGTGKTLLGMEFLVRGALDYGEPGVFVSFEERCDDLVTNSASLGFDLTSLIKSNKMSVEQIAVTPSEFYEAGDYNLDGLFIRLGAAIESVGAKRVVIDTIEVLLAALTNESILRSELQRLFEWLKDKGVTTIVTGERGDHTLTRSGIEEYVSDCVISLDQRVTDQIATRRLRIVKYRGTTHGANEYPFLIDEKGFLVLPITAIPLDYRVSEEFVPTGVSDLDDMLGGNGYIRGSTVLVTGAAGTAKSSIAAHFADATCARGERCIYFAFEESPDQIERNMRSIGIDLEKWRKRGLLSISASRPATFGLEVHINMMLKHIEEFQPSTVVLDPISSFDDAGTKYDAHLMLMRTIDVMKARRVTTVLTALTPGGAPLEQSTANVSSLIDTWVLVRNIEQNGVRTRGAYVLKSRGMNHSNEIRELVITDSGVKLREATINSAGLLVPKANRQPSRENDTTTTGDAERKKAPHKGART